MPRKPELLTTPKSSKMPKKTRSAQLPTIAKDAGKQKKVQKILTCRRNRKHSEKSNETQNSTKKGKKRQKNH